MIKTPSVRDPNIKFVQMIDVGALADLTSHTPMVVESLRNINDGEECFLNYGTWYTKFPC